MITSPGPIRNPFAYLKPANWGRLLTLTLTAASARGSRLRDDLFAPAPAPNEGRAVRATGGDRLGIASHGVEAPRPDRRLSGPAVAPGVPPHPPSALLSATGRLLDPRLARAYLAEDGAAAPDYRGVPRTGTTAAPAALPPRAAGAAAPTALAAATALTTSVPPSMVDLAILTSATLMQMRDVAADRPLVLAVQGLSYFVTDVQQINGEITVFCTNPANPRGPSTSMSLAALKERGGKIFSSHGAEGFPFTVSGRESSLGLPLGNYTFEGPRIVPDSRTLAVLFRDEVGEPHVVGLSELNALEGASGTTGMLISASVAAADQALMPEQLGSNVILVHDAANTIGLADCEPAILSRWVAAQTDTPFLAKGRDGGWSVAQSTVPMGGLRLQSLADGTRRDVPLANAAESLGRLLDLSGAAKLPLIDGTGKTWLFGGFAASAAGDAVVMLNSQPQGASPSPGAAPGRDAERVVSDRTVSVEAFIQTFGEHGRRQLVVAAQSTPTPKDFDVTWIEASGALFRPGGDDISEIRQMGKLGDCYFAATMVAAVARDKDVLPRLVGPSADGIASHVDVRFFGDGGENQIITVDNRLPALKSAQLLGLASDIQLTYTAAALVEKAFTIYVQEQAPEGVGDGQHSGYGGIEGASTGGAYWALFGKKPDVVDIDRVASEDVWKFLCRAGSQGSGVGDPMSAGTRAGNAPNGVVLEGIIGGHAYAVLSAYHDPYTDQRMVRLRNPWGDPTRDQGDVFTVSLEDFVLAFRDVAAVAH